MMKKRLSFNGGKKINREVAMATVVGTAASTTSSDNAKGKEEDIEWEMRPNGMFVQKRTDHVGNPAPLILVRVVFGVLRYEIAVCSQATFGELKKRLTVECGLQHWEQRLMFKGKHREDKEFLDFAGVKDKSKIILVEDECSREKRLVEMRRNDKIQRSHRAVSNVSVEVDTLADQVSQIEKSISIGVKVPEVQITTLVELLMRQAVNLDSIPVEGEVAALKKLQGKRVQKCVEALDVLKISNSKVIKPAVVTTKWETFDPTPPSASVVPTTQFNLLD